MRVKGRQYRHVVGLGSQLLQAAHEPDPVLLSGPSGQEGIVHGHIQPECLGAAHRRPAYVPHPHEPEHLPVDEGHGASKGLIRRPLPRLHGIVQANQVLGARQQQHYGVVGDLLGHEPGRIGDNHALIGRRLVVHPVEAVPGADYGLGRVYLLYHLAGHRHAPVDDHVGALDRLDHLALAGANVNVEVVV